MNKKMIIYNLFLIFLFLGCENYNIQNEQLSCWQVIEKEINDQLFVMPIISSVDYIITLKRHDLGKRKDIYLKIGVPEDAYKEIVINDEIFIKKGNWGKKYIYKIDKSGEAYLWLQGGINNQYFKMKD